MSDNPYAAPRAETEPRRAFEHLATREARLGAAILDGVLAMVVAIPGVVTVVVDAAMHPESDDPGPLGIAGVLLLVATVGALTVVQWWLTSTRGQSIGKRLSHIHIRRVDGSPVDFVSGVVLRSWAVGFLGGIVNLFTCGFLGWIVNVVDVLMIFGDTRQCLHDRIAGTVVLQGHPPEWAPS